MKRTKYMMSKGLAFAEKGDLEKLSKKAKQGWHLKSLALAGYRLEKSVPEEIEYSIDYRLLREEEKEEYFEIFSLAGWEHVCSSYDMHIFKALPGTNPIYSDKESAVDKIERLSIPIFSIGKFIFPLTVLFIIMMSIFHGPIEKFSTIAFCISLVFATPTLMMVIALMYRKRKLSMSKEY